MGFMLLKNFTLFVLAKLEEKKWVFHDLLSACQQCDHLELLKWSKFSELPWFNFNLFYFSFPPTPPCSKECLVTSSGIDNTENGLSGSKADSKPTPKKKWESACIYNLMSTHISVPTLHIFVYMHMCFAHMQIHCIGVGILKLCLAVAFKGKHTHMHTWTQRHHVCMRNNCRWCTTKLSFKMCTRLVNV